MPLIFENTPCNEMPQNSIKARPDSDSIVLNTLSKKCSAQILFNIYVYNNTAMPNNKYKVYKLRQLTEEFF